MALGIALDRSGSMSVSVGPNLTKMDLANQGAAAAISMLTLVDSTAVYAVDTEPHPIIILSDVDDPKNLSKVVLGIESAGGGIYVGEALKQMYTVLAKAKQRNRHVALFADANDAVDQGDVFGTIEKMRKENITISVIALGKRTDSDANFLAKVALNGGGDIYFTTNPVELPKLFAMDTMLASKSAFNDQLTAIDTVLGASGLGGGRFGDFPAIEGYNITYFKKTAQVGYRTTNTDPIDPILTHHRYGLGQAVAYLGQIDGTYGQNLSQWNSFSPLFHSILLAISSKQPPNLPYVGVEERDNKQVYTVESHTKQPKGIIIDPDGNKTPLRFTEIDDNLYQAEFEQERPGVHVATFKGDDGPITLPPSSLPYSIEFKPRSRNADQRELQRLSGLTIGEFNAPVSLIFEGSRESKSMQNLQYIFAAIGLLFLLIEIADRRLQIFSQVGFPSVTSFRIKNLLKKKQSVPTHQHAPTIKEDKPQKEQKGESGLRKALQQAKKKK